MFSKCPINNSERFDEYEYEDASLSYFSTLIDDEIYDLVQDEEYIKSLENTESFKNFSILQLCNPLYVTLNIMNRLYSFFRPKKLQDISINDTVKFCDNNVSQKNSSDIVLNYTNSKFISAIDEETDVNNENDVTDDFDLNPSRVFSTNFSLPPKMPLMLTRATQTDKCKLILRQINTKLEDLVKTNNFKTKINRKPKKKIVKRLSSRTYSQLSGNNYDVKSTRSSAKSEYSSKISATKLKRNMNRRSIGKLKSISSGIRGGDGDQYYYCF